MTKNENLYIGLLSVILLANYFLQNVFNGNPNASLRVFLDVFIVLAFGFAIYKCVGKQSRSFKNLFSKGLKIGLTSLVIFFPLSLILFNLGDLPNIAENIALNLPRVIGFLVIYAIFFSMFSVIIAFIGSLMNKKKSAETLDEHLMNDNK